MYLKKVLSFIFLSAIYLNVYAQKETYNWYFSNNAGIKFDDLNALPTALIDGKNTGEGVASISNKEGQLLFYTNGDRLFRKNHTELTLPDVIGLGGSAQSIQSAIIVPMPKSSRYYYIFTVPNWNSTPAQGTSAGQLSYSIFDVTLNGGLGGLATDPSNNNVPIYRRSIATDCYERIAAVGHSNGEDIWVVTHKGKTAAVADEFVIIKITKDGIEAPKTQKIGNSHLGGNRFGVIKISSKGDRIVSALGSNLSTPSDLEIFEFNNSTGVLSNPIRFANRTPGPGAVYNANLYGAEFSPSGDKIYACYLSSRIVQQFDWNTVKNGAVNNVYTGNPETFNLPTSRVANGLQLGPDSRLYIATNTSKLYYLAKPDLTGNAAELSDELTAVDLAGKSGGPGLPNFISTFNRPFFEVKPPAKICSNQGALFLVNVTPSNATWKWNFGDGKSDYSSFDNKASVNYTYENPGTYIITVSGEFKGLSGKGSQSITVESCEPSIDCAECIPSFSPEPGKKYLLSAWVKERYLDKIPDTYSGSGIKITFNNGANASLGILRPSGPIIDGWQRIESPFTVPTGASDIEIELVNDGAPDEVFFDDVRIHPFKSNMKSFVYDPSTQRLTAELDENNYATRYEYDDEGILIRVKKETERGLMTIKETRNNQSKINTR